ncbi:MAG: polysaccharide deacetylase family protein [Actinobacteria bacterium]|nr:polysaccharide deacetylase family protein [Actinomycetota bacterium]
MALASAVLILLAGCSTGGAGVVSTPAASPTITASMTPSGTPVPSTPMSSPTTPASTPPTSTTLPRTSVPPTSNTPPPRSSESPTSSRPSMSSPSTSSKPPTSNTPPASTPPPSGIPAALRGQDIERIPTDKQVVALTFDAGANAAGVASILATLAREKVPGTFFLTGRFAEQFTGEARQVAAAQRVGNHSVTHPQFSTLSAEQVREQVLGAAATIKRITGADPAPLFRFPFGDRTASNIAALNALGYVPVGWTVDSLGWKGTSGGITADVVVQRVLSALQPGEIVLMHVGSNPDDGSTLDAAALPRVISALRDRGYGFVSLDALFTGVP